MSMNVCEEDTKFIDWYFIKKYQIESAVKTCRAEHPLWSAFSEMVRNSDFLTKLVRKRSAFHPKSQNFRFWLLNYDEGDFEIIYIEDPVEDYIWIFFICELKVRIDIQEGQILVCISVKIWSEKSQNFNNFGQKSIVGALI